MRPAATPEALEGLADGLGRRAGGETFRLDAERLLEAFYAEEDPDMRRALLGLLRHAGGVDVDPARAMEIAASGAEPPARRIDMLALVEMGDPGAVVPALRDLAVQSASEAGVQAAAARALGGRPETMWGGSC